MRPLRLLGPLAALALSVPCCAEPKPPVAPDPACQLPAPKKSADACTTDADCAPSTPCHAYACVAKAKSEPRGPSTTCSMILLCATTDANRCGCFDGRCSLIPPPPGP